ncbi:hypothetical protein COU95_02220 [Candidatus Shapirobacteria bacterium CG10_big_fil_rev_8_21_14_0_10_40_9]|uniref:Uncharacterized protein n=1 Tax=Candidatus Shapirobacteria bacterium CG10_big_fil_rev_8_21_14_0_10_40_9 TaxID=1974888 RepID=A0A2M8L3H6_9BACT|nr:MAG: hypothetical protein COU95_02220 [Candidatus Shapirobacteria bacterium CG10_big_fil_rev_8_21_14_0_10_40_9]
MPKKIFEELTVLPPKVINIIVEFGKFIDDYDRGKFSNESNLTSKLPYSKDLIADSLQKALKIAKDKNLKNYLFVLGATLDILTNSGLLKKVRSS